MKRILGQLHPGGVGLYQQDAVIALIKSAGGVTTLARYADHLVSVAEDAHTVRNLATVSRIGNLLVELPLPPQYWSIGAYFEAISMKSRGPDGRTEAAEMLHKAFDHASPRYKSKVLLSLGADARRSYDLDAGFMLYAEASRAASCNGCCDPLSLVQAQRMIAVLKSMNGDHKQALAHLASLLPLARMIGSEQPHAFYDFLNSYAVELANVGLLEEARNASSMVVSSRFAPAYPEWRETYEDIADKRRSSPVVAAIPASAASGNVIPMPSPKTAPRTASPGAHNRLLSYVDWKQKAERTKRDQDWRDAVVSKEPECVLRAEAFEVVGPDGEVRGSFRSAGDKTVLSMSSGKLSIGMVVTEDGTAEMGIIDRSDSAVAAGRERRVSLGVRPDPENDGRSSVGLVVSAQRSDSRFEIALDGPDETPLITLYGSKGRKRMQLLALKNGKSLVRFYDRRERIKSEMVLEDFDRIESLLKSASRKISR